MGKRGPPKTPTAILNARGSWRGKERKDEPIPPNGKVEPHEVLDAVAKKLFARITEQMAAGVVTPCDTHILSIACQAFSDWVKLTKEIRSEGVTLTSAESGVAYANPKVSMRDKARDAFFRFCRDFGLTPSSRANIAVESHGGESEVEDILTLKVS